MAGCAETSKENTAGSGGDGVDYTPDRGTFSADGDRREKA